MYRKYVFPAFPVFIFTLMLYILASPVYASNVSKGDFSPSRGEDVISIIESGNYEKGVEIIVGSFNLFKASDLIHDAFFNIDFPGRPPGPVLNYSLFGDKYGIEVNAPNLPGGQFSIWETTKDRKVYYNPELRSLYIQLINTSNNVVTRDYYLIYNDNQFTTYQIIYDVYTGEIDDEYLPYSGLVYFDLPDGTNSKDATLEKINTAFDLDTAVILAPDSLNDILGGKVYFTGTTIPVNNVTFVKECPSSAENGDICITVRDDGIISQTLQYSSGKDEWSYIGMEIVKDSSILHLGTYLGSFIVPPDLIAPSEIPDKPDPDNPAPDKPDPDNPENPVPGNMNGMMEILNLLLTFSISILFTIASNPILLFVLAGYLVCICIYILDQIKRAIRDN